VISGANASRVSAGASPAAGLASTHESFLVHSRFRYLKLAVLLSLASLVAYLAYEPRGGVHNGGTWLGYTLGTIGALLIVWLMLLGLRKRRYGPGAFSLKGWLSAHVYLGLALTLVATLHAAFQVGWNIHTLAYALMLVVIASGVWGIVVYRRIPRLMTVNRGGQTFPELTREIVGLDAEAADLALGLGDEYAEEIRRAREETRLGGGVFRQLSGEDRRCGTTRALANVRGMARRLPPELADRGAALLVALGRKQELLRRARKDIRYKATMDLWLYVHVPLSFALLAALTAHVVSVFFYWG
jgi:hypothetical protein